MLRLDYFYSPFNFIGYHKLTDNICSNAQFVVIDIDTTTVSIHDRHAELLAEGLTHILGTTSDPTNMYKYRLLLLLDKEVTADEYKLLVYGIKQNGLVDDMDVGASCKPGGVMYSYANSTVLSHFDGDKLSVDDYMLQREDVVYTDTSVELMANFESEFKSYSRAMSGGRTRALFSVAFAMQESSCSYEQIVTGVLAINSSFLQPKLVSDVYRRVLCKFNTNKGII